MIIKVKHWSFVIPLLVRRRSRNGKCLPVVPLVLVTLVSNDAAITSGEEIRCVFDYI